MLKRGTPVIINDVDCPEGRLVAVMRNYDEKEGLWYALYLSDSTNMKVCCTDREPTPLAHFGVWIEWDGDKYHCVQKVPSTAFYYDGEPRAWQDRRRDVWWTARRKARALLQKQMENAS